MVKELNSAHIAYFNIDWKITNIKVCWILMKNMQLLWIVQYWWKICNILAYCNSHEKYAIVIIEILIENRQLFSNNIDMH